MTAPGWVEVLDASDGPPLALIAGEGRAWAVIWPGVGAHLRSLHRLSLPEASSTVELLHASEAAYYVISGTGEALDLDAASAEPLVEGSMIHIDAGTRHAFRGGRGGLELVGGPSPPDPALYAGLDPRG